MDEGWVLRAFALEVVAGFTGVEMGLNGLQLMSRMSYRRSCSCQPAAKWYEVVLCCCMWGVSGEATPRWLSSDSLPICINGSKHASFSSSVPIQILYMGIL